MVRNKSNVSCLCFATLLSSSPGNVSVGMALEARPAQTVRRTTGETPGHSAEVRTIKTLYALENYVVVMNMVRANDSVHKCSWACKFLFRSQLEKLLRW